MSDNSTFRPKRPYGWSPKFPLRTSLSEAIPTEIIERIIDYYATNRSMLKTCSLVGKGWHPRSRYLLMSDMFIPDSNRRDELLGALKYPNSLLKYTPITGVTATRTAIYSTSRFEGQERVTHHVEDATKSVIQSLPDLKYLHLRMYLHIPAPGDECPSNIVQIWLENRQEKLTHLTISNLWLRADGVFPHILALLNLEHLCLHYYSEPNDIELGDANQMVKNACRGHPYPSKLRSLALQGRGIDFLLAYMDRSNPSPPLPLTDLHLDETTRDIDLETLGRLYQSTKANFRSLNVFGRDPIIANLSNQLSLRHTSVTYIPLIPRDHSRVIACLKSIKSPLIESITIEFMIGAEADLKAINWSDLRAHLEADNLKNLKALRCVAYSHDKKYRQVIQEVFHGSPLSSKLVFQSRQAHRREILHGRELY